MGQTESNTAMNPKFLTKAEVDELVYANGNDKSVGAYIHKMDNGYWYFRTPGKYGEWFGPCESKDVVCQSFAVYASRIFEEAENDPLLDEQEEELLRQFADQAAEEGKLS